MADKTQEIKDLIANNDVVLFVKGTSQMPMCGFSASVIQIFSKLGVSYKDVNILADEDLRATLKTFSDWPTFPQIYVKGEFIGGCDIIKEMYETGELQKFLSEKQIANQ